VKRAVIWVLLMFGGMILDPASADRGSGIAEGTGPPVATFSIVGYDPNTDDLGVAEKQVDTELADGLMAALQAAQEAGGEKQGRQSAALLVVRKKGGYAAGNDRYINLRVEDYEMPIIELGRLLKLHQQFFRDAHKNPPGKKHQKN